MIEQAHLGLLGVEGEGWGGAGGGDQPGCWVSPKCSPACRSWEAPVSAGTERDSHTQNCSQIYICMHMYVQTHTHTHVIHTQSHTLNGLSQRIQQGLHTMTTFWNVFIACYLVGPAVCTNEVLNSKRSPDLEYKHTSRKDPSWLFFAWLLWEQSVLQSLGNTWMSMYVPGMFGWLLGTVTSLAVTVWRP